MTLRSLWQLLGRRRCRILLACLLMVTAGELRADAAHAAGLKPDVRILIDISGSMRTSDPDNLRAPALDLIVRLLPEGAKAGVWIFGQEVQLLVEHRVVDDAWRREAAQAVAAINNSGQRTNIPAALAAATYDMERMDPGYRTSIVLLTDGKVDVSESPMINASAAAKLLRERAPQLGETGIPVHTVALSENADWGFLRNLADHTSGIAEEAKTADRLTEIFLQSLEMVAPTPRVPVAKRSFQIDDSVEQFTALVFYEDESIEAGLVDPDGERYTPSRSGAGIDWFRNRKFALVTVSNPLAGEWRLVAPRGTASRVTVVSDLALDVDPVPNSLPAGKASELGLRIRQRSKPLDEVDLLQALELAVEIRGPGGYTRYIAVSADYPVPTDGEYRVAIPAFDIAGRYEIIARLSGQTLKRELPMYVEVLPTASDVSISTRGVPLPEEDIRTPMVSFAAVLAVCLLGVGWLLYRRRQRKLALWQQRQLNNGRPVVDDGLASGLHAESGRDPNRP